jgi:hypothetical protein
MSLREFEDANGGQWRVWDTIPDRVASLGEFCNGWLTFDNGTERRRFAPVPEGWAELPVERLNLLLRLANTPALQEAHAGAGHDRRTAERREAERRHRDRRDTS